MSLAPLIIFNDFSHRSLNEIEASSIQQPALKYHPPRVRALAAKHYRSFATVFKCLSHALTIFSYDD
jgi:hypothetical protein